MKALWLVSNRIVYCYTPSSENAGIFPYDTWDIAFFVKLQVVSTSSSQVILSIFNNYSLRQKEKGVPSGLNTPHWWAASAKWLWVWRTLILEVKVTTLVYILTTYYRPNPTTGCLDAVNVSACEWFLVIFLWRMFCEITAMHKFDFSWVQTLKSEPDFTAVSSCVNELPGKAGSRFASSLFRSYLSSNRSWLTRIPPLLRRFCQFTSGLSG